MIFIDVDGVLANLQEVITKHTGSEDYTPNCWSIFDKIPNFFNTLPVIDGAKEFVESLSEIDNCAFLTALPLKTGTLVTAETDKINWLRTQISQTIPVICVSNWNRKFHFATSSNILIDDQLRNIMDWRNSNGIGIVHETFEETLKTVLQLYQKQV